MERDTTRSGCWCHSFLSWRAQVVDSKTAATSGHAALAVSAATEAALAVVGASVRHRAGFDLAKVAPVDHVGALRHCGTPLLLIHGARDDFIHPDHSRDLLAAHGGDAELVLVDRDHQAPRPASCIARACLFCYDRLFDQVDARRQAYARRLDQLAAIEPTCGALQGGTLVTLRGAGFDGAGGMGYDASGAAVDPRCRLAPVLIVAVRVVLERASVDCHAVL